MNKRRIGAEKEQLAVSYLKSRGYRILKRNFFTRNGEIDIIARDGDVLCFIEVKYRSDLSEGYPEEAVNALKIRRITRSALVYMNMSGLPENTPCRFDVVSILGDDIRLIRNAFDAAL